MIPALEDLVACWGAREITGNYTGVSGRGLSGQRIRAAWVSLVTSWFPPLDMVQEDLQLSHVVPRNSLAMRTVDEQAFSVLPETHGRRLRCHPSFNMGRDQAQRPTVDFLLLQNGEV